MLLAGASASADILGTARPAMAARALRPLGATFHALRLSIHESQRCRRACGRKRRGKRKLLVGVNNDPKRRCVPLLTGGRGPFHSRPGLSWRLQRGGPNESEPPGTGGGAASSSRNNEAEKQRRIGESLRWLNRGSEDARDRVARPEKPQGGRAVFSRLSTGAATGLFGRTALSLAREPAGNFQVSIAPVRARLVVGLVWAINGVAALHGGLRPTGFSNQSSATNPTPSRPGPRRDAYRAPHRRGGSEIPPASGRPARWPNLAGFRPCWGRGRQPRRFDGQQNAPPARVSHGSAAGGRGAGTGKAAEAMGRHPATTGS